ncbi:hypothetical protein L9G15_04595 [Shewanella sp. A3A]|nr:hypothetical protein [Shewanella ferrihydritica]
MKSIVLSTMICSPLLLAGCGVPDNSAMSCFNADLYQTDNAYLMVEFDGNQPTSYLSTTLTAGEHPQQTSGKALQRMHQVATGSDIHYSETLAIDADNHQFALQNSEKNSSFGVFKRKENGAPQLIDFNFAKQGESRHSSYSYINEFALDDDQDSVTMNYEQTTTFHGIEQITTPAGTFSTCHMEVTTKVTNADDGQPHKLTIHTWYAQQLGIPVDLSISGEEAVSANRYRLVHAQVNGDTFAPTPADIEKLHLAEILATANTQG